MTEEASMGVWARQLMDEEEPLRCPSCKSTEIDITKETQTIAGVLGPTVSFDVEVSQCQQCGDFSDNHRWALQEARQSGFAASIPTLLESVLSFGLTEERVERYLLLPLGTMARWRAGDGITTSEVALLRILATYPWVIAVADARFEPRLAASELVMAASRVLASAVLADNASHAEEMQIEVGAGGASYLSLLDPGPGTIMEALDEDATDSGGG